ncbi:unnamed protein product [Leptidea sinapis]|uniref:Uncharacterized protein n=1 Tax=Leptidea sinapis TaxID=189913 RepID=A0A5E4PQQ0_9NEOP|nr:unnamed protein product [Leptidea sinapis]
MCTCRCHIRRHIVRKRLRLGKFCLRVRDSLWLGLSERKDYPDHIELGTQPSAHNGCARPERGTGAERAGVRRARCRRPWKGGVCHRAAIATPTGR